VDACAEAIGAGEPGGLVELLEELGAPTLDMLVTPLGARAALLGAETGRAFYHHELRRRIPMPPDLEPEVAVWQAGTVPFWESGVLAEPKYFSFFQEAPLPAFNPNYRRKWRSHELLHGAAKFFWHPRMTRFEFYVSARLNELLPIIQWYGLDEVFRPRCPRHKGRLLYAEYCQACEDAAIPYWQTDIAEHDRGRQVAFVDSAWDHLTEEWQAISQEIQTGEVHATPRLRLDASSDAIGYMKAHWNRATSWSFGHWTELFLIDGEDYFGTLNGLRDNSEKVARRLVSGALTVSPTDFHARRGRHTLQDLAYRLILAMEWLPEGSKAASQAEDALMPDLEDAASLCRRLLDDARAIAEVEPQFVRLTDAFLANADLFPTEVTQNLLGLGTLWENAEPSIDAGLPQLIEGLHSALPETMARLDDPHLTAHEFAYSGEFQGLGRLSTRFARWFDITDHDPTLRAMARFEGWAALEPRKDEEGEDFGTLPDELADLREQPGRLRPNQTLRRSKFPSIVMGELTGDPALIQAGDEPVPVCAVVMRGELRLMVEDADTTRILDILEQPDPPSAWTDDLLGPALESLLENGFVLWLPRPRS
ncbi:MAG: hypothetical protein ACNA8W_19200, partial [Bradymonadaceae bacterium]